MNRWPSSGLLITIAVLAAEFLRAFFCCPWIVGLVAETDARFLYNQYAQPALTGLDE